MPDEVIFLQEYFVYCKKKWRTADEKAPLFGRVDGFQIDPNDSGEFCIPVDSYALLLHSSPDNLSHTY